MKESIGNAYVFGIFITFAFLLMLILTVSINYSRASKIKDRILAKVQAYAEANSEINVDGTFGKIDFNDEAFHIEIDRELATLGYRRNNGGYNQNDCPSRNGAMPMNPHSDYRYCIYSYSTSRGYYYGVTTYMYFDVPVIGTTLEFPIYGETRIIYNLGNK